MMGFKIVKITWTDASSIDAWQSIKELPETAHPCYSVGFQVKVSKDYYYLANTHTVEDSEQDLLTSGVIMIPKKWVAKYEVLEDNKE
jgi:hypothetical protein